MFFPVLHFFIMLSMPVSDLMAVYFSYTRTWQFMPWFMAGVMVFNMLWLFVCTRHFRIMRRLPLYAVDWLGAVLWVLAVMQAVYVLCYGEFYNWWDSSVVRTVTLTAVITLALAVARMFFVRHPYLEPKMWLNKHLPVILFLAFVIEGLFAVEHVLEEVFYESGMGWHKHTTVLLDYPVMAGNVCGCLFSLLWLKVWQRGRVRLVAVGVAVFTAYALLFYFGVSPDAGIQRFCLPVFLRGFAAALLNVVLLYSIQSVMNFFVFFQSLAVFQTLHILVGGVAGAACYSFGLRRFVADGLSRYGECLDSLGVPAHDVPSRMYRLVSSLQVAGVKQIYGAVAYVAIALLFLILLYDTPLRREHRLWMPSWRPWARCFADVWPAGDRKRGGRRLFLAPASPFFYMFTVAFTPIAPNIAEAMATIIFRRFFHFSLFILLIFFVFWFRLKGAPHVFLFLSCYPKCCHDGAPGCLSRFDLVF